MKLGEIVKFNTLNNEYILTFDTERSEDNLIQFGGILYKRVEKNMYKVHRIDDFIIRNNGKPSVYFTRFTGIEYEEVLKGITKKEAVIRLKDLFPKDSEILLVGHGVQQDVTALETIFKIPVDYKMLCTHKTSRTILKDKTKFRLTDIAEYAEYIPKASHNAYDDAVTTAKVLEFLMRKKEK